MASLKTVNKELIRRLRTFIEGDMVERVKLHNQLEALSCAASEGEGSLCRFFADIKEYLNHLDIQSPVEEFYKGIADFLEALGEVRLQGKTKELLDSLKRTMRALKGIIQTHATNGPLDKNHIQEQSAGFTQVQEDALDYSGLVTDQRMVDTFLGEVKEFLDSAQAALLDLEHDPQDSEAINKVFRCFHTIKSSSAFLGIKNMEVLAHEMENTLGLVRNKKIFVTSELIDIIFSGIGTIHDLLKVVERGEYQQEKIVLGFKAFKLTPYIQLMEKIQHEYKYKKIGEILQDMGAIDDSSLKKVLEIQKKDNRKFGDIALEERAVSEAELRHAVSEQGKQKQKHSFVKVSSERLNTLVDMVGELVVNQSMLREGLGNGKENQGDQNVNQLEIITTTIKDIVLSMGMVPMEESFQRLRVVIRNTARELDKLVNLEVIGEDTEMDRNLVEAIYDPLTHMVRNAVSHGIEPGIIREKSGKNPVGQITLSALYKGNGIEITVEDDGGGIDPEKIWNKAVRLEMVKAEEKEHYFAEPDRIYQLLFLPGFSTKDQADSISGRGVGMDVVLQNVNSINGKVEIHSELGRGTTFRVKLPLTLAIIDGFVTDIQGEFFVFPFDTIEEILVPNEVEILRMEGESPMVLSRERYIPLLDFYQLLTGNEGSYAERYLLIHVCYDGKPMVIPVDRVLGKQEIVIKNLNELAREQKLFSGGTIFGDGSIGFILDFEEIIKEFRERVPGALETVNKSEETENASEEQQGGVYEEEDH